MWCVYLVIMFGLHVEATEDGANGTSRSLELKLPWVRIPKVETYYVCQQFTVPDDQAYHVTRFDVLINNTAMVHHLLLFGCEFEMDDTGPHPCDTIDSHCRSWMTKWDVGMAAKNELPQEAGVRFGKDSYKYLLLQIHWNNRHLAEDETDTSGIRLTYTSDLRKYDIGNVQVGQNKIVIPPSSPEVTVTGQCSSKCTALLLPRSIFLARAYLHMHQLGVSASLDVQTDREVTHRIASEHDYDFLSPVIHSFSPAYRTDPGDQIRMTCRYSSTSGPRYRNETVTFGKGTNVEMCYAFIMYYPKVPGFEQCIQDGDRDLNCDVPI